MREWRKTPGMQAALGGLLLSVGVVGWTVVRAVRGDAFPVTAAAPVASLDMLRRAQTRPAADIPAAVESDLFADDRTAPGAPYRMPGEGALDDKPDIEPEKPVVLGTAVATDGRHFATLQLGATHPTLVHVGDTIGEWIVRAIERGKVTLVNRGGTRADVTVPKPGI
jgi:hypothetical protein